MKYDYVCNDCISKAEAKKKRPLTDAERADCMFETEHAMFPSEAELKERTQCPVCDGHDTVKSFAGQDVHVYVAGNGYLDKHGALRDMNVYKLTEQDPYANMRVPGEVDEMANRFRKAGKRGFETAKHIDMGSKDKPAPKKGRKKI